MIIVITIPLDNFGTVVGENPDCLLLFGTVVGENPDHVCWDGYTTVVWKYRPIVITMGILPWYGSIVQIKLKLSC